MLILPAAVKPSVGGDQERIWERYLKDKNSECVNTILSCLLQTYQSEACGY